jgi:hypothetical protein
MVHTFFDELRVEGARMPNGKEFPPLFDFTREGELAFRTVTHLRTDSETRQNFPFGQT